MNCKNCGTPITNEDRKCPSCGLLIEIDSSKNENNNVTVEPVDTVPESIVNSEVVTTETPVQTPVVEQAPVVEQTSITPEVNKPQKKNSTFKILIALILLVVIVLGIYFGFFKDKLSNSTSSSTPSSSNVGDTTNNTDKEEKDEPTKLKGKFTNDGNKYELEIKNNEINKIYEYKLNDDFIVTVQSMKNEYSNDIILVKANDIELEKSEYMVGEENILDMYIYGNTIVFYSSLGQTYLFGSRILYYTIGSQNSQKLNINAIEDDFYSPKFESDKIVYFDIVNPLNDGGNIDCTKNEILVEYIFNFENGTLNTTPQKGREISADEYSFCSNPTE